MTSNKFKDTMEKVETAAHQVADKTSRTVSEVLNETKGLGRDIQAQAAGAMDMASEGYQDLGAAASDTVASAKASLAAGGDRMAKALRDAAEGSRHASAHVVGAVASSVADVSGQLRDSSLSDLVSKAQAYARRHPGAVVVGAAVAGFGLALFLQSSARKGSRG